MAKNIQNFKKEEKYALQYILILVFHFQKKHVITHVSGRRLFMGGSIKINDKYSIDIHHRIYISRDFNFCHVSEALKSFIFTSNLIENQKFCYGRDQYKFFTIIDKIYRVKIVV